MVTDESFSAQGLTRSAYPKTYIDARNVIAMGRGEMPLPPPEPPRKPVKVDPRQIPMFGEEPKR